MRRPPDDTVGTDRESLSHAGSVSESGSTVDAGPTTEAGPLGRVDPVSPTPPGTVPRPPLGTATMTVVVGFAALVAILIVFGSIAEAVRAQEVFGLDTWATPFLHGIASPGLDALMNALTDIGSSLVIVPILFVVGAWLLRKQRYGAALFLSVASVGSLVLQGTMKVFFARPRPHLDWVQQVLSDYSFPSGHTMSAVIFYVALALVLWSVFGRRIGLIARLSLPHGCRRRTPRRDRVAARRRRCIPRSTDMAAVALSRHAGDRQARRSFAMSTLPVPPSIASSGCDREQRVIAADTGVPMGEAVGGRAPDVALRPAAPPFGR